MDPDTHVFPFRLPEVPGEKTFQDMEWCPGSLEPEVEEVPPIDPAYRMLFVIGAQKAGTTWLAHNVARHPSVVYGQSHLACASSSCCGSSHPDCIRDAVTVIGRGCERR